MSYTFTSDEIGALDAEQRAAIMEALVIAVLADGAAPKEETDQFDREIDAIPWGLEKEQVRQDLEAVRGRVLAINGPEPANQLVRTIADRLSAQPLREKTLHAISKILFATKKMNNPGALVFGAFATAFQIPQAGLEAIKHSVKGK